MLEAPDLDLDAVKICLQGDHGLAVDQIVFMPLGADVNTAVYRVVADDGRRYFLKARQGHLDTVAVEVPRLLSDRNIKQVIPPLRTLAGGLWIDLDAYKLILYPFVEGRDAYDVRLSGHHWAAFGAALRRIHTLEVPSDLAAGIRQETYTPKWRDSVRHFLARVEIDGFDEPVAAELAAFLRMKRSEISGLVDRAEALAQVLQVQPREQTLCHSDIHAGNLLIADSGELYIVDWDEPILAPKERDLMYVGGGLLSSGLAPEEEEALFYAAYGPVQVDPVALAYYRYERIVQDIAAYCEQLLLTDAGGSDRVQALRYLKSNFLPNGTIEIAHQAAGVP